MVAGRRNVGNRRAVLAGVNFRLGHNLGHDCARRGLAEITWGTFARAFAGWILPATDVRALVAWRLALTLRC